MPMRFRALAETLEALEPVTGRLQLIAILADLLRQADPTEVGELVYLIQGRLLPDFIQEEFGMNERLIVRSISQAYGYAPEDVLERWKQLGDIGLTAQEYAERYDRVQGGAGEREGIALNDVYARLMEITRTIGPGSQEGKIAHLASLLKELKPLEAKHVTRIVVGRLRVGVGDPTVMEALSMALAGARPLRPPID